jgi:CRP/FNR family cyclic AMP-dependent transcriptional regulator
LQELKRIPIFQKLSSSELEMLMTIVVPRQFPRDTVLFFEGDPSDSLHLILSGAVKVYRTSPEGHERILKILGPQEIVGELAMLDGEPRSASVAALDDTRTLSLSRRDFEGFVAERPAFLWKVLESLCDRLRHTNGEMTEMVFRSVPYRLLYRLAQLCRTHGETSPAGCRIRVKLTTADLAAMVGSGRETVGRLLERFQEEGLIRRVRDELVVPDLEALTRALEYAADWS